MQRPVTVVNATDCYVHSGKRIKSGPLRRVRRCADGSGRSSPRPCRDRREQPRGRRGKKHLAATNGSTSKRQSVPFHPKPGVEAVSVRLWAEERYAAPPCWLRSSRWRPSLCRVAVRTLCLRRFRPTWRPSQIRRRLQALLNANPNGRMRLRLYRGTARMVWAPCDAGRDRGRDERGLLPIRGVVA